MKTAPPRPSFSAIIVAAGNGTRAGLPVPKQFAEWNGAPLVRHSAIALLDAGADRLTVVVPEGEDERARKALEGLNSITYVTGSRTRQGSVRRGLEMYSGEPPERILIHDAARPRIPERVIDRLLESLASHPGAIPVLPVIDSVITAEHDRMAATADRNVLRRVQTPQAFRFTDILNAHRQWLGEPDAGDDAQVLRAAGKDVALVDGDSSMNKLTFGEDFPPRPASPPIRIGFGYDVHRLVEGTDLWLGGVPIPHDKGLAGHSDADVVLHALVDAILGALGEGDIGTHFPPSDERWRGAASSRFLTHAVELAKARGYSIAQTDCTIICEAPKIGPYRESMCARMAELLSIPRAAVSIKATTTEGLGFTGRGEGIAAHAVATLQAENA